MSVVILDRDGVINHDSPHYIRTVEQWLPIAGSCEAIQQLCAKGWKIAVATNQSGIGRGLYSLKAYREIEKNMLEKISSLGGTIDYVAFCPHTPEDNCDCRKPKPGMLLTIAQHLHAELEQCYFVGDSYRDIQAAQACGCKPVLVRTGNGEQTMLRHKSELAGVCTVANLADFVTKLIQR